MKSSKLKKLVAVALVGLTVAALSPIGASAEWKQNSTGWWNTEGDSYSIGWRSINGSWYFFDSTGYMKTGWLDDNGTWYYLASSGAMANGWVSYNGTWYYLASSGAMTTGWINDNGTWYFADTSGAMQTGVVEVDGKVYYLQANGSMATGTVVIDGVAYTFAASGEAIGNKIPTPTKAFAKNGASKTPSSSNGSSTGGSSTGGSSSSGGGGGSSHSSSSKTFQQQINTAYSQYATIGVSSKDTAISIDDKTDNGDGTISFKISFNKAVDSTVGGTTDYVTQDIQVTNSDGTDTDVTYNDGVYTVKSGAKVYAVVRAYRSGQIGYVYSAPQTIK